MIESSGARAVPIRWNSSKRIIEFLLNSVNGVLIQGNYSSELIRNPRTLFDLSKTHFRSIDETAYYILSKAFEFNKNGIHFPVWMNNYGFEFAMLNWSRSRNILSDIKADKYTTNIILNDMDRRTEISTLITKNKPMLHTLMTNIKKQNALNLENVKKFKMFSDFEDKELNLMFKNKTMYFDTTTGVSIKDFYDNKELVKAMLPTSFAIDKNGSIVISSFEFKDFPFYGTLFQNDKVPYTLNGEKHIDHSLMNIQINRKFTDFFVEESKKNYQKFTDKLSEYKLVLEHFKLRYRRRMRKYMYILAEKDDEYDNINFV